MWIGYATWVSNGLNPWKKYYNDAFSHELVFDEIHSSTADYPVFDARALNNPATINIIISAQVLTVMTDS